MNKTLQDLLLLGDPRLYQICAPVLPDEAPLVEQWVTELSQVMDAFRATYRFGRAIAAPQLGIMKRLVFMHIDQPVVFINPTLTDPSAELIELWDDCMSFPQLLVKLKRHRSVTVSYMDRQWKPCSWNMRDDLAELIQHECDHLDGILCTMRAIDAQSFRWRPL
jgi:peptide deformylase